MMTLFLELIVNNNNIQQLFNDFIFEYSSRIVILGPGNNVKINSQLFPN